MKKWNNGNKQTPILLLLFYPFCKKRSQNVTSLATYLRDCSQTNVCNWWWWWWWTEPLTRWISGSRSDVSTSMWEETNSWRAYMTADVACETAVRWWLMTGLTLSTFVLQWLHAVVLEDGYLLPEQGPPRWSVWSERLQFVGLHVASFHVWL